MWTVVAAMLLCGMVFGESRVKFDRKLGYDTVEIDGETYHTGYKPSAPHPRRPIRIFPRHLGFHANEPLPLELDYRPYNLPAFRQRCGDCWAQGAKSAFQGVIGFFDHITPPALSAQAIIDCSGYGSCGGGQISIGFFVDPKGAIYESDYPYMGRTQRCNKSALKVNEQVKSISSVKLTTADIQRAAFEHGPFEICGSAGALGGGGRVDDPGGGTTNHCYSYQGYLDGKTQGWQDGVYHIILNSWGTGWGDNGYGYYRDNGRIFRGVITGAALMDYKPRCTPQPVADSSSDETNIILVPSMPNYVRIGTPALAGMSYQWSPAAGLDDPTKAQPVASPTKTTKYTVTVTSACGKAESSIIVHVFRLKKSGSEMMELR